MNPDTPRIVSEAPLETGRDGDPDSFGLTHWQGRRDVDGVLWLLLDQQGASSNTLSEPVLEELATLLERIRGEPPQALVVRSLKPDNFIVGADIGAFRALADAAAARERVAAAQAVINALAALEAPTIALIHGHCLGGGLELALACRYRIARSDARLGFPEVQLGLHPGLGGTARLPALIAPDEALRMMLTGRPIDAQRALELGLVDAVTPERHLGSAVRAAARGRLPSGGARLVTRTRVRGMSLGPARKLVARQARQQAESRARPEHYPAPYRLLELWEAHGQSVDSMLAHEPASFAELVTGETSRNLVRVYFLREALRRAGKSRPAGIDHVHVIGAGTMGGDIAAWCAHRGFRVSLEDQQAALIAPAVQRAAELFARRHDEPRARRAAADRLMPDPRGHGRAAADLVIEAVPERLDLKQRIFADLLRVAKPHALLVSNTSGILLEHICSGLAQPQRIAGLHFFNPVSRMPLVELVRHDALEPEALERLAAFVVALDRLPVPVRSAPGFLVNRILSPYLLEALTMLDEGVPGARIDAAAEAFGLPVGPVELADQIGLDICLDVADGLREALPQPMAPIPDWLRRKVAAGELGRKSGRGLYEYHDGKPRKGTAGRRADADRDADPADPPADDLTDRLVLPMINAAVACRADGVVDDDDALDAAMIFGTGFAPFRGGPLHYARTRGAAEITARLRELAERHGPRFAPHDALAQVVAGS